MTQHTGGTSGRGTRRAAARKVGPLLAVSLAAVVAGAVPAPAHAVDNVNIGQRYHDRLDTRYSAISLTDAAQSMGYTATGDTNGRHVDDVFLDGIGSAVLGLFGHSNAGIFQTDEGATNAEDSILAAGTTTDVVSPYVNVRFLTEYLPYAEVDDMRLLVLAGCDTALAGSWGDFNKAAVSRGVDSVISFSDLVYYPATTSGTPIGSTDYSGNYFWGRFSYHARTGATISTALARARTDLVAKEGRAGGWDTYVIRGAVSSPGSVRLNPAGPGQPWNSDPLATLPFSTFAQLTPVATTTSRGTDGTELTNVTTAEGVLYRTRPDGTVLDAVGAPTASGEITFSAEQARAAAQRFAQANIPGFAADWELIADEAISHLDGDALQLLRWRTVQAGRAGAHEVTIEIDRRTGAVTYLSDTRGTATDGGFVISVEDAIAIARRSLGSQAGAATAVADTWHTSRWIVTVDRGHQGPAGMPVFRNVDRIEIDAHTGTVLSHTTT